MSKGCLVAKQSIRPRWGWPRQISPIQSCEPICEQVCGLYLLGENSELCSDDHVRIGRAQYCEAVLCASNHINFGSRAAGSWRKINTKPKLSDQRIVDSKFEALLPDKTTLGRCAVKLSHRVRTPKTTIEDRFRGWQDATRNNFPFHLRIVCTESLIQGGRPLRIGRYAIGWVLIGSSGVSPAAGRIVCRQTSQKTDPKCDRLRRRLKVVGYPSSGSLITPILGIEATKHYESLRLSSSSLQVMPWGKWLLHQYHACRNNLVVLAIRLICLVGMWEWLAAWIESFQCLTSKFPNKSRHTVDRHQLFLTVEMSKSSPVLLRLDIDIQNCRMRGTKVECLTSREIHVITALPTNKRECFWVWESK